MKLRCFVRPLPAGFFILLAVSLHAQAPAERLVIQPIDDTKLVALDGNVHPLADPRYDHGAVPDAMPAQRIFLLLNRPPAREAALQQFLGDVHRRGSATYHDWITPEEFGKRFGPADEDIQRAEGWLQSKGFSIARVSKSKQLIEFSGTAGQLRDAFHTEIHQYGVDGETHYANASEISIPAALAPLVRGISPLNNFRAKPLLQTLGKASYSPTTKKTVPLWTLPSPISSGNFYAVAPEDFATQYDLAPLYQTGVNGAGQTIGIINVANIDVGLANAYRQLFNLSSNPPQVVVDGDDPGANGASTEAYLDVEVSGAVAPGATVLLYISSGSDLEDPLVVAAVRAVEDNQASVLSMSFGSCEQFLGTSGNQLWAGLWEEAAAQGQTVLVSSGDSGGAGCDPGSLFPAQEGLAVNGYASTPWNVAVGGTDFFYSDYASGAPSAATLWNQTNDSNLGSLKAPLPEQVWDDALGLNVVNLHPGANDDIAAGGGPSSCAVRSSSEECVSGYPKPNWQTGTGVPTDGVRDVPDVSLFAAVGSNLSAYAICAGAGECAPGTNNATEIFLVGGTSASSPAMAGIMALINQKYGRQGQADFTIYPLAQQKPAAFHDITLGSNNVNCLQGSLDCSLDANGDGLYTFQKYLAGPGYDLASGLGSVDANALVNNWNSITFLPTTTSLSLSSTTITHGTPITVTTSVATSSGSSTPAGGVAILTTSTSPQSQGQTVLTLKSGTASTSVDFFPGGYYNVLADYHGDGVFESSTSSPIALNVSPENSNINFSVVNDLQNTAITNGGSIFYDVPLSLDVQPIGVSAAAGKTNGNATGTATFKIDSITATVALNATGVASWSPPELSVGNHTASAMYSGDASFNASSASPVTFSVTKAGAQMRDWIETPSATSQLDVVGVGTGGSLTVTVQAGPSPGAPSGTAAPTGTVTVCLSITSGVCNSPSYSQIAALSSPNGNNSQLSSATVTFTNLQPTPAGEYALTYLYSGDANWESQGISSLTTIVVSSFPALAPTTTNLSITPTSISGTELATFTITVTGAGTLAVAPTGFVLCYTKGIPIVSDTLVPPKSGTTSSVSFQLNPFWNFWNNGANPLTVVYEGDDNYQPSIGNTVNLTVSQNGGDFSFAPQIPQITLKPGSSGTVGLNMAPLTNFSSNVALTCAPSSSQISCSVNPTQLTVNGAATATLTITASANSASAQVPTDPARRANNKLVWLGAGGGFLIVSVILAGLPNRRRRPGMLLTFSLLVGLALAGCGSSGGQSGQHQPPPPNASIYSVLVNATAGGIVHNAKVIVVVQ